MITVHWDVHRRIGFNGERWVRTSCGRRAPVTEILTTVLTGVTNCPECLKAPTRKVEDDGVQKDTVK